MKNIKLLIVLPLFIFFFVLGKSAFAQVPQGIPNSPLFDMTKAVTTSFISVSNSTSQEVNIFPFSKAIIKPGSFNDNVNLYVFKGKWDKIKPLLPANQSPISSYFLVFLDSKGKQVTPKTEVNIVSYNNYGGTDTFYYPVATLGSVDAVNSKKWTGQVIVNTLLPLQDSGFIVSVNKILAQEDPSLDPQSHPFKASENNNNPLNNQAVQKYLTLGVLIAVALLLSFMLWGNKKSHRRKNS